jgi:hypothetical protein
MKKQEPIEPKNLTAQLAYRGQGNPPTSHPSTAVSNSYPGLEMDFRNVWKHIFKGIELLEYNNLVIGVDKNADEKIKRLTPVGKGLHYELISVDGIPMTVPVTGPSRNHGQQIDFTMSLEWSNALTEILPKAGQFVRCRFQHNQNQKVIILDLIVQHFFDVDVDRNGKTIRKRVVISKDLVQPGDLTQSLCSPWQNDYRECGCFYWAASRPDFVNVEPGPNGKSMGNNWMEKNREPQTDPEYIVDNFTDTRLVSYDELFTGWEQALRFIFAGKDEPPLKKSRGKKKK